MKTFHIQTATEVAHGVFIGKLQEHNIEFSSRIVMDSAFPSFTMQHYGEVLVPGKESQALETVFKDLDVSDYTVQIEKSRKKGRWASRALILYAIIVSLICLRYWYIAKAGSETKNFNIEWNHNDTILRYYHKDTDELLTTYKDNNYDLNFERLEMYAKDSRVSASYDRNEDGYYEQIIFYDLDGNATGELRDDDGNGIYEYQLLILEDGDTLKLVDKDQDGQWERRR